MNIHEHQAKGLLRKFGVSVPDGYPAFTVEEAVTNAKNFLVPYMLLKHKFTQEVEAKLVVLKL